MFVLASNTIKFNSSGDQTNPTAAGSPLATTGALPAGRYLVWASVESSVNAMFSVQHRNAADAATVETLLIRCPANDSRQFVYLVVLEANERVRIQPSADITGQAGGGLNWQRIS